MARRNYNWEGDGRKTGHSKELRLVGNYCGVLNMKKNYVDVIVFALISPVEI